ncbi:MAG: hypothetical protein ABSF95_02225 [Verrucomicrobiota bacterium]
MRTVVLVVAVAMLCRFCCYLRYDPGNANAAGSVVPTNSLAKLKKNTRRSHGQKQSGLSSRSESFFNIRRLISCIARGDSTGIPQIRSESRVADFAVKRPLLLAFEFAVNIKLSIKVGWFEDA